MIITKEQIIDMINAMPQEEFTDVDIVIEEIILLEKIKRGLAAAENGETFSEEEVDKITEAW